MGEEELRVYLAGWLTIQLISSRNFNGKQKKRRPYRGAAFFENYRYSLGLVENERLADHHAAFLAYGSPVEGYLGC